MPPLTRPSLLSFFLPGRPLKEDVGRALAFELLRPWQRLRDWVIQADVKEMGHGGRRSFSSPASLLVFFPSSSNKCSRNKQKQRTRDSKQ